jgi:hypothetical protein
MRRASRSVTVTEAYSEALAAITPAIVMVIRQHCADELRAQPHLFDATVQEAVREIGRQAAQCVAKDLAEEAVAAAKAEGWRVERCPAINVWTVFGRIALVSPYLTSESAGHGVRPVNEVLGVRSSGRTSRLERAMCDFGVDESFEGAARKLCEHYGLEINRTTFRRTVEKHGAHVRGQASMASTQALFERPVEGPGLPHLVEMDGSCVRTGSLAPKNDGGLTPKRRLPARARETEWRDLRLAFVRRLDQDDAVFVGAIDDFEDVIDDLLAEASAIGWTPATFTLRVTDGGRGLREALDARFPCGQHVLDKPHLLHHLHEVAAGMHAEDATAKATVEAWARRISAGEVAAVVKELRSYRGPATELAATLAGYLTRFSDAVNYDELERLGYPIGSGEIESAHKGEVQQRLKLPGTWWTVQGANSVLALRLLRTNRRWDDYWRKAA